MLSPKSSAQYYLSKFLGAVESYLHPANSGKWVGSISEVVVQLPKYLFDRLVYERYKPHPWKKAVPGNFQLVSFSIDFFVFLIENVLFQRNIV